MLGEILSRFTNPPYPIVLLQYKRDDFDVGQEEHFHWALSIITNKDKLVGQTFQTVDRIYQDERGKVWITHFAEAANIGAQTKCLGGVQLGTVRANDARELAQVMKGWDAKAKFEEWNCRDYVMEIVNDILQPRGLLRQGLETPVTQDALLPELKDMSKATRDGVSANGGFKPRIKYY